MADNFICYALKFMNFSRKNIRIPENINSGLRTQEVIRKDTNPFCI